MKRYPAWTYNPRPRGWPPADYFSGPLPKLRKLVLECQQDGDDPHAYRLPGSTFKMTITPETDRRLWDN